MTSEFGGVHANYDPGAWPAPPSDAPLLGPGLTPDSAADWVPSTPYGAWASNQPWLPESSPREYLSPGQEEKLYGTGPGDFQLPLAERLYNRLYNVTGGLLGGATSPGLAATKAQWDNMSMWDRIGAGGAVAGLAAGAGGLIARALRSSPALRQGLASAVKNTLQKYGPGAARQIERTFERGIVASQTAVPPAARNVVSQIAQRTGILGKQSWLGRAAAVTGLATNLGFAGFLGYQAFGPRGSEPAPVAPTNDGANNPGPGSGPGPQPYQPNPASPGAAGARGSPGPTGPAGRAGAAGGTSGGVPTYPLPPDYGSGRSGGSVGGRWPGNGTNLATRGLAGNLINTLRGTKMTMPNLPTLLKAGIPATAAALIGALMLRGATSTSPGERAGLDWTDLGQALGGLIPGTQRFLGEVSQSEARVMTAMGGRAVKSWSTGTATFVMTEDGRVGTERKNGVIRIWRPQRHIVVSRNPRVGTLMRADRRLSRLTRRLRKTVNRGAPRQGRSLRRGKR